GAGGRAWDAPRSVRGDGPGKGERDCQRYHPAAPATRSDRPRAGTSGLLRDVRLGRRVAVVVGVDFVQRIAPVAAVEEDRAEELRAVGRIGADGDGVVVVAGIHPDCAEELRGAVVADPLFEVDGVVAAVRGDAGRAVDRGVGQVDVVVSGTRGNGEV